MARRRAILIGVAAAGVIALGAQSAAAATDICVAANGDQRVKKGSADCKADGTGSTALAKGDGSYASATGGTRNRARVRADGGTAYAGDLDFFLQFGGSFNTAKSCFLDAGGLSGYKITRARTGDRGES